MTFKNSPNLLEGDKKEKGQCNLGHFVIPFYKSQIKKRERTVHFRTFGDS